MGWSGGGTIGFSAAGDFYRNHNLSGTPSVRNIACKNTPGSNWTNIIYQLSKSSTTCLNIIANTKQQVTTTISHFLSLPTLLV